MSAQNEAPAVQQLLGVDRHFPKATVQCGHRDIHNGGIIVGPPHVPPLQASKKANSLIILGHQFCRVWAHYCLHCPEVTCKRKVHSPAPDRKTSSRHSLGVVSKKNYIRFCYIYISSSYAGKLGPVKNQLPEYPRSG